MFKYFAKTQNHDLPSQILSKSTTLFCMYNPSYQIPSKLDDSIPHTRAAFGNTSKLLN